MYEIFLLFNNVDDDYNDDANDYDDDNDDNDQVGIYEVYLVFDYHLLFYGLEMAMVTYRKV